MSARLLALIALFLCSCAGPARIETLNRWPRQAVVYADVTGCWMENDGTQLKYGFRAREANPPYIRLDGQSKVRLKVGQRYLFEQLGQYEWGVN